MKLLGILIYSGFLLIGGAIWRGYVLSILWAWFIVTYLHAPALTTAQAIGVSSVVTMFVWDGDSSDSKEKDSNPLLAATVKVFLTPLLFLGIGAIVKNFT